MLNISRIKVNQTMKCSQLIEYPKRNICLYKLCRKWSRETSSRPFFVFLKIFILGKSKWSAAWFHYISLAHNLAYNRNKLFKTLHYWIRDIFNFDFLDEGPGIVSLAHLCMIFQQKCSSKNTIICLCIQSSRVNQILALWSAEVRVFLSPIRKFNHFYLNFWRKYPPVCCVVSANLSRLLCTFYIPIHHMYKWRWVNFCHIYSKQYNSNMKLMFYITHTGAFLTLLLLIDTTH